MTRSFHAPRERVWEALTKPELLQQWLLGPDGWTMPVCEFDLRPGGSYRYVWRSETDGSEFGMGGVFREVTPLERFVATEKFDEAWYPGDALVTNVFTEEVGKTTLNCTVRYDGKETRDSGLASGMEDGVTVSYDRLAALLSVANTTGMSDIADTTAERESVHKRLLNASRQQVFRAFAEPEHLAAWWGPNGFKSTIHEFAFRPGARWRLTMHGPDGTDYENEYLATEIVEPERIVLRQPDPSHEFQLTVTLTAAGENKTDLTWRQVFASREHFQQVKSFVADANEQVLDRLEAEVAKI